MKKTNKSLVYVFLYSSFAFAVILLIFASIYVYTNSTLEKSVSYPISTQPKKIDRVELKSSDGNVEKMNLPVKVDSNKKYTFTFLADQNTAEDGLPYLCVYLSYSSFTLRSDGEVLYSNVLKDDANRIAKSGGKRFEILPIPEEYLGKTLEIEFESNINSFDSFYIPSIYIGSRAAIMELYFGDDLEEIFSSLLFISTAFFLFVIAINFIVKKHSAFEILIISLFSLSVGFYLFIRTRVAHYYIRNYILTYTIEYSLFMIIPLTVLLLFIVVFYENLYKSWRVKVLEILVFIFIINFISQFLITFTGLSEFIMMKNFTAFLIVLFVSFIFFIIPTIKVKEVKDINYLLLSVFPLSCVGLLLLFSSDEEYCLHGSACVIVVSMFFLLVHFLSFINTYVKSLDESLNNKFYEELAYFDILTSLKNRNAFNLMFTELEEKNQKFDKLYLLLFDINNLKVINDNYGHNTGDEILTKAGEIFSKIENMYEDVFVYRYGGDEFVMLCFNKSENDIERILEIVKKESEEYISSENCTSMNMAAGYVLITKKEYESTGYSMIEALKRADKLMYQNKAEYKGSIKYEEKY